MITENNLHNSTIDNNEDNNFRSLPFLSEEYNKVLNEELNKPLDSKEKSNMEKQYLIKVYGDVHKDLKKLKLHPSESFHLVIRRLLNKIMEI